MIQNFIDTLKAWPGKYIAILEGDGYWIDPYKLQKQVDFLETNPEYGMIYSKKIDFFQELGKYSSTSSPAYLGVTTNDLMIYNPIPTMTLLLRSNLLFDYIKVIEPQNKNWEVGDYPLWLWFSIKSKINGSDEVTSVYRILNNSASHRRYFYDKLNFSDTFCDIRLFFNKKFNLGYDEKLIKGHHIYNILLFSIKIRNIAFF